MFLFLFFQLCVQKLCEFNLVQIKVLNMNNFGYVQDVIQVVTQEDEWDQFGGCINFLANCVELDEDFMVNAKEDNE